MTLRVGGRLVLSAVDLTVLPGQFHGVGGERAATSALVSVVSSETIPESGHVVIDPLVRVLRADALLDPLVQEAIDDARLVVVDDLDDQLDEDDEVMIHEILGRLVGRGVAVLFVTARPREIRDLCDAFTLVLAGSGVVPIAAGRRSSGPARGRRHTVPVLTGSVPV